MQALFYVLGTLTVLFCGAVVWNRNPVYGVGSLVVALVLQAGMFALLGAPFLAAVQVVVYAGAVMVLFLFVVMMIHIRDEDLEKPKVPPAAFIGGAILLLEIVWVIRTSVPLSAESPGRSGSIARVGKMLLEEWAVPFEIVSLLLLAAIVGAVTLGRKTHAPTEEGR